MSRPISLQAAALKKRITERFADAGWAMKFSNEGAGLDVIGGIIVCDIEQQHLLMVGLTREGLNALRRDAATAPFDFQNYCDAFGSFLTDIETKPPATLTTEERHQLGVLATLYVTGTKTYRLAQDKKTDKQLYYLVLRYIDHEVQLPLLRPAAVAWATPPTPEDIEEFVQGILALDRQAHPRRFKSADVIPFKPAPV